MEGNYPPGFYCPDRAQQERPEHSQTPQQQQQHHVAPYPLDLPAYHPPMSHHQSQFGAFPTTHPVSSILSSMYHDSTPGLSNSNLVHQSHQQPPVRGQEVKSSTLSTNFASPVTTHGQPLESNTPQERTTVEQDQAGQTQSNEQGERSQTSTPLSRPSPSASNNSSTEPPLLTALSLMKNRTFSASPDLPSALSFKRTSQDKVEGVIAKETVERGVEFGPYIGTLMNEEEGCSKDTTWEVCISGKVFFYIDGSATWMSQLRCAQNEEEQNIEAFQYYGEIYFRTTKVIEPGSELRVFYSEEYQKRIGIHTRLNKLSFKHDAQKFQCGLCDGLFTSSKLTLRHLRCEHSKDGQNEAYPVLMWKKKVKKKTVEAEVSEQPETNKENEASNQKDPELKCKTCDKVFPSLGRLKEHELFHNFSVGPTCPVCEKKEKNAKALEEHMKKHGPVEFKCHDCNRNYKSKSTLRKHMNEHHGHQCRICLERFPYKTDCRKHEETHQAVASSNSTLKSKSNVRKTPVPPPAPEGPKDMLGKTVNYYERPFKCRYCPKRYSLRSGARNHEKEVHSGEAAFKCSHCPKVFSRYYRMVDHLRSHEENRMYRCALCPRSFGSESALKNHQGEHTGLKPFKCEICGKGFKIKKAVTDHKRRIHQKRENRFFCSVCNKGFTDKGNFIKHERRHKGIRPFVCMECGKGFTAKTCLKTHMQSMHTTEKPFSCELCGKTFSLNQNYTYHMFRHKEQGDIGSTQAQP